jgi:hypothetical protein
VNLLGADAGIIRDIRVDLAFDVLNVVGGPASGVFSSASMFVSSRLLHCSHVVLTCIRTHLRVFRHRHHLIQSKMQLLALLLGKRHCSKVTRERPCRRRAAQKRDELAASQLVELHSVPRQPGPDCRISNWRGSVRR